MADLEVLDRIDPENPVDLGGAHGHVLGACTATEDGDDTDSDDVDADDDTPGEDDVDDPDPIPGDGIDDSEDDQ